MTILSLSHPPIYQERVLDLPAVSLPFLPPEMCSGPARPYFWGFIMQNQKGGEGRKTTAFRLDVKEEIFSESLEESGMRSVPGYEKNKLEKKLKF